MSKAREFPYWLLAATLLAYLNALGASFQFDDFNVIVDNPAVHSLAAWWDGMPGIRPLLKLSYTLNWLADPGPIGFHAVNLALHGINVALVWRLTGHFPAPAGGDVRTVRLVTTVLFALHPIQTESVTYVSGRSMSLMAAFGLAGLLAWLEAPERRHPRAWHGGALLLFAAAILSKEVAVVLPVALLLFSRRAWLPALLAGLALLALFLGFGYARLLAEPMPRDLASNLISELNAVYYLIGQVFQPHRLNIDPLLPELEGWRPASLAQAGGLAGLLVIAALKRVAWPWLGFALGWFILLLLPTHSLIPRLDLASERHFYLAALGLYWLAGIAAGAWLNRAGLRALLVALTLAGMAGTHLRNRDYQDEISLWRQTTVLSPGHARAWNNLGWAYLLAERHGEARVAFARALEADPDHVQARRNLDYLDQKVTP
ncbi:MAG: tetratricopeptide repeat protein [Pseudomonadota bacterium]